jgi:penicillin-binding protein 1A
MCAAYSAIANNGEYITPTFYIKVTDKNDNIIYEPNQEKRRVMSEQNAYIEQNILTQTVVGGSGTAKYCAIKGMDVAAKTGTTNGDFDRWLSGFTPYYTASVWYGYDKKNAAVVYGNGNPAGRIWSAVMSTIHEPLENAKFVEPEGIIKKSVCRYCGLLATENSGSSYVELFTASNVPTEKCAGHSVIAVCVESGYQSAGACPEVKEVTNSLPPHEQNTIWKSQHSAAIVPEGYCPIHGGGGAGPGGGGPTSYVTPVDQAGFQAATDAAAMGLTGAEAQAYINAAKEKVANGGVYTPVTH